MMLNVIITHVYVCLPASCLCLIERKEVPFLTLHSTRASAPPVQPERPGGEILTHRTFLALSIPLMLSALSTPLLGVVDTAVIGRIPDPSLLGGVAVGTLIFNTLYWLLGFLRVSTSGFTAQAQGAGDPAGLSLSFYRPLLLAGVFGLLLVLLQSPIRDVSLALMTAGPEVEGYAGVYYNIRIWGAPFALANYVVMGWLIGVSRVKGAMFLQIGMNLSNILLCLLLVGGLKMEVTGVAWATLLSEVGAAAAGVIWVLMLQRRGRGGASLRNVINLRPMMLMLKVNRDLLIRTACLLAVFFLFTSRGAALGEDTLAANAILLQIHYVMAYLHDGFANASSILTGRALGERNAVLYRRAVRLGGIWSFGLSAVLTVIVLLWGSELLTLFTGMPEVLELARQYLPWLLLYPLAGFWGLQLYGVFAGATMAGPIRNSLVFSLAVFIPLLFLTVPPLGNHGLWLSFIVFTLGRSVFLWMYLPRLNRLFLTKKSAG
ncbi:MATE family efflux transporter [Paenibacillus mucilaginosus]|nr:MATE family efflux transporter [Paenibacillus mucilaginosus]WDM25158.1 MATE family efflux transporter [Paenibacillus mucilaginosus]